MTYQIRYWGAWGAIGDDDLPIGARLILDDPNVLHLEIWRTDTPREHTPTAYRKIEGEL